LSQKFVARGYNGANHSLNLSKRVRNLWITRFLFRFKMPSTETVPQPSIVGSGPLAFMAATELLCPCENYNPPKIAF